MKKPLLAFFFVLLACAFALYASLYVPAYIQEKKRAQDQWASSVRKTAPEANVAHQTVARLMRKSAELRRLGITGAKRDRLLEAESKAAGAEGNRVRASGYKSPFDEKTLPIDPK